MSFGDFGLLLSSLNGARDLLRSMIGMKVGSDVRSKLIELQGQIDSGLSSAIDAKAQNLQLITEIEDLRRQLKDVRTWEAEAARYQLKQVSPGVFVYSIREESRGEEPEHVLCSICFTHKKKAILQYVGIDATKCHVYSCQGCDKMLSYPVGERRESAVGPITFAKKRRPSTF